MYKNKLFIYLFYRFKSVKNIKKVISQFEIFFNNKLIKGTVLIANEGINAQLKLTSQNLVT